MKTQLEKYKKILDTTEDKELRKSLETKIKIIESGKTVKK